MLIFIVQFITTQIVLFGNDSILKKSILCHDLFTLHRLILRIQSSKEHKAKHDFNKKFGCDPDDAPRLLETAKIMGLDVVGVR